MTGDTSSTNSAAQSGSSAGPTDRLAKPRRGLIRPSRMPQAQNAVSFQLDAERFGAKRQRHSMHAPVDSSPTEEVHQGTEAEFVATAASITAV
jgi:hypothetical protein